MKECNKCHILKDDSDFHKNHYSCKECRKLIESERYLKDREKILNRTTAYSQKNKGKVSKYRRKNVLKMKYNMTLEDYDRLLQSQGERCAICRIHQSELNHILHVDHDHTTGKVRGLLCRNCNHGLGKFFDNTEIVQNLLYYLYSFKN